MAPEDAFEGCSRSIYSGLLGRKGQWAFDDFTLLVCRWHYFFVDLILNRLAIWNVYCCVLRWFLAWRLI